MSLNESKQSTSAKPMLLSLATHTVIVLVLFLTIRNTGSRAIGEPDREVSVVLTNPTSEDKKFLTEQDMAAEPDSSQSEPALDPASSFAATEPAPVLELTNPTNQETIRTPLASQLPDASRLAVKPSAEPNSQYELTESDLKLIESDQRLLRSREPVGEPTSISVFGTGKLTGRSFVFVLDRSQSMGQGGLGVIDRARTELSSAINKLEINHKFQIVAYHDKPVTIERRNLLQASDANKALAPDFIARLAAYGGTGHKPGIIAALAFRPDVVVLMTDGGYPILNSGELRILQTMAGNRSGNKGTEIHCVQFGMGPRQTNENFMLDLATQNHGTYRYIDVNSWDK